MKKINEIKERIEGLRDEIKSIAEKIEIINLDNIIEDEDYCDLKNYGAYDDNFGKILEDYDITLFTSPHFNFYENEGICANDDPVKYLESILEGMETWFENEIEAFEDIGGDAQVKMGILGKIFDKETEKIVEWIDDEFDTISWNELVVVTFENDTKFLQHVGGWRGGIMELSEDDDVNELVKRIENGENIKDILGECY